jgi:hypothetical protein
MASVTHARASRIRPGREHLFPPSTGRRLPT